MSSKKSVLGSFVGLVVLFLGVPAHGRNAQLIGTPVSLQLAPGDAVGSVNVVVKKGWLNSDVFSLDLTVIETTVGGANIDHGRVVVAVSATQLFGGDGDDAEVVVHWPDNPPVLFQSFLTVCVQVLLNGGPFGGLQCDVFGPFSHFTLVHARFRPGVRLVVSAAPLHTVTCIVNTETRRARVTPRIPPA